MKNWGKISARYRASSPGTSLSRNLQNLGDKKEDNLQTTGDKIEDNDMADKTGFTPTPSPEKSPSPESSAFHENAGFNNLAFSTDDNGSTAPPGSHDGLAIDPATGLTDQEIELRHSNFIQLNEKGSIGRSEQAIARKLTEADIDTLSIGKIEEYRRKEQERRDSDPLRLCKWIAQKPVIFFVVFLSCHILMLLVTAALARTGYDILPLTFDRLPLDIRDDVDYLRELAWRTRDKDPTIIIRGSTRSSNNSERSEPSDVIEMIFRMEGGNVFTKDNLLRIKEVEDSFFNNPEFQSSFCLLDESQSCTRARSILRYFDGTFGTDPEFNNPNFDNPETTLYKASTDPRTKSALQYHLGHNSKIVASSAESDITRGYLMLGMPLRGYASSLDREDEQMDKIENFVTREFKAKAESYYKSGVGPMEFIYNSGTLISLSISGQVFKDMALAVGSLTFIVMFVCLQTGSLWIGLLAIFSIITSFCGANLIYRVVLDYRYLGIFHVLAVFIILGIGADDIFVFYDTWKESSHHKYKSLGHRLSDCYRRAALAMFFTSVTTAIAFAVSATSPFLGIGSFGVFSCVLVMVNYVSVITFFPCVVITYHNWWQKYKCCFCCPKKDKNVSPNVDQDERRRHPVVRFFRGPYFRFVTHNVARWFILFFFTVFLSVCIYFASTLKVNEEQVKFLPDNSNFGKYLHLRSSAFASSSETGSQVHIVFGLKPQNLDDCHKTDPACFGLPTWDDKFNMNSPQAQQKMLQFCTDLKSLSHRETDGLAIRRSLVDDVPEVECFVENMKIFYQANYSKPYPLVSTDIEGLMSSNAFVYDTNLLPNDFNRHFEVATSFWLYNGFTPDPISGFKIGPQLAIYNEKLGEARVDGVTIEKAFGNTGMKYYYATRLRYAALTINITIQASNFGFPKGLPIRDAWEDYISRQMAQMPAPLQGGFQICTGDRGDINVWHWFKTQQTLSSSAMMGIAIGICVAFPILVVATQNIIVGFLATLTICCITCSVIAIIPMAGWKLGMLESLNLVLVVGLSVDYVVHLAEGYSRSIHHDRKSRTRSALEEVGISILSGAITTLGAAIFLFGAFILFFTQFGIFLFSTIGFSILYALCFFVTLIALIGPEGETGSLKPIWRWCAQMCTCCSRSSSPAPAASATNGNT